MKKKRRSHTVFFGGEVFTLKQLIGNAYLAEAIYDKSHGRYLCQLPQDFNLRGHAPHLLRDEDMRTLAACDLALFGLEGDSPDPGVLVEFMVAKFADIPCVVLCSDLREAHGRESWSPLASSYPRTFPVRIDSLSSYKRILKRRHRVLDDVTRLAGQHGSADAQAMCEEIASACVRALDRALASEPIMPKHVREEVYNWLPLMTGLRGKEKALRKEFERYLESKVESDLL